MVKKVIVADDTESWRGLYADRIRNTFLDVHVDQVETGSDLVERVLQGSYLVVISDNDMEKKGAGLEALRRIRESGSTVPFYLVSGGGSAVGRNAILNGADGFYDKATFDPDKMLRDITPYLSEAK